MIFLSLLVYFLYVYLLYRFAKYLKVRHGPTASMPEEIETVCVDEELPEDVLELIPKKFKKKVKTKDIDVSGVFY